MSSPPLPLPPAAVYTSCYCEENIYLLAQTFVQAASAPGRAKPWAWEIYVVFVSNGRKTVALWSQKVHAGGVVVWDYHVFLVLRPLPRDRPHTKVQLQDDHKAHAPAPPPQPHLNLASATSHGSAHSDPSPEGDQAWVYDFDTTLPVPCPWREYVAGTFPYAFDDALADRIDPQFLSLFRVIPAGVYLDCFASDRSHMIVAVPSTAETETQGGTGSVSGQSKLAGSDSMGTVGTNRLSAAPSYSKPPPPYPPLRGRKARELGIAHNLMESFVAMGITPASVAVAQEEEGPVLRAAEPQTMGPPADSGGAEKAATRARSAAAMQYGQVTDVGGFVRWLSGESELDLEYY
ncbi:hypothetical protein L227DRAFT_576350 [Lentinus tigrinus ALCF2SS1-6]|uniref:Protein N-terminal glutamine amidohydrolase n=1 Tax=Lentinus tigrinus ALCF2SS1-6 TaxID=1328759 RepID=A0A5C2S5X6_9APHY|nr:hypothetical protein L227DRAFT_576350 [Lentinus tigrinus ALCF2SS1-6]